MALLTYPLSLAQFFQKLPVSKITLDLPESLDIAKTEGGDLHVADLGPRLWTGSIDLSVMLHDEAPPIRSLINHLRGSNKSFLVSDLTRPWPQCDPGGLFIAGSTPVIAAIGASMRELSLSGLPARYTLKPGDLLSFTYGAPERYGLHEVVGEVTAGLDGVSDMVEVNPPLRIGVLAGAAVQLLYPRCKARLVPGGSDTGTTSNTITTGMKFTWIQQLGGN